jgi:hypothetical protein
MKDLRTDSILIMLYELDGLAPRYKAQDRWQLDKFLEGLESACQPAELKYSIEKIRELRSYLTHTNPPQRPMVGYIDGIRDMIERELKDRRVLCIETEKAEYYESTKALFGMQVPMKFPDAVADIKEAGSCYATGRNTACVFHLMRVAEHGLRALARQLGVSLKHPTDLADWKTIIDHAERNLDALRNEAKTHQRENDLNFYGEALIQFEAFKDAWRNHVSHARSGYDEHQAMGIFVHVRSFMERLATRLDMSTKAFVRLLPAASFSDVDKAIEGASDLYPRLAADSPNLAAKLVDCLFGFLNGGLNLVGVETNSDVATGTGYLQVGIAPQITDRYVDLAMALRTRNLNAVVKHLRELSA